MKLLMEKCGQSVGIYSRLTPQLVVDLEIVN